ncbi:hypothetical protein MKW94_017190 [Papaver nudicaule]|uniref:Transcription elongation factor 1 homolog n=1 Tax=Papaver nudicaule TaxID=74823 RepID=A0AA41VKC3_PAPNU|nr:hypothetical protein [Papaver nudicaule]MCL7042861.1 hypothetical protein [Papaver nudicaule]
MARRKSRAKPEPKKKLQKLDKVFDCPFCNHHEGVECFVDKKNWIGSAVCGVCQEGYNMKINHLTEAIDIYSEWIDECERVNNAEEDSN